MGFVSRRRNVCLQRVNCQWTQIIVQEACHEANGGPWYKAAERCGAKIRVWRVDPDSCETRLEDLRELVGPATKLVALVHVSNILGEARRPYRCVVRPRESLLSAVNVQT